MPRMRPTPFAAVSVRRRKIVSGTSGERDRSSMRMKAADSTAQPTNEKITSGDVQPSVGARVSANTNRIRPAVTVVAPHASKCRARSGALLSRT